MDSNSEGDVNDISVLESYDLEPNQEYEPLEPINEGHETSQEKPAAVSKQKPSQHNKSMNKFNISHNSSMYLSHLHNQTHNKSLLSMSKSEIFGNKSMLSKENYNTSIIKGNEKYDISEKKNNNSQILNSKDNNKSFNKSINKFNQSHNSSIYTSHIMNQTNNHSILSMNRSELFGNQSMMSKNSHNLSTIAGNEKYSIRQPGAKETIKRESGTPKKNSLPKKKKVLIDVSIKSIHDESLLSTSQEGMSIEYLKEEVEIEFDDQLEYYIEDNDIGFANYFETYHIKKGKITSDNILSNLQNLEPNNVRKAIDNIQQSKEKRINFMKQYHQKYYSQYKFCLNSNFNLLFYGYGSKRETILDFAKKCLITDDSIVLVINGYFPNITLKTILTLICKKLRAKCLISKPIETVQFIKEALEKKDDISKLYLIVHNIDGENLRSKVIQNIFMSLSQLEKISLICTIDHIRATLLWDNVSMTKFNFLSQEMTTFIPYKVETSFETSPLIPTSLIVNGQITLRGVTQVLASVNAKAKGIFKILVNEQLKEDIEYNKPATVGDNELIFNKKNQLTNKGRSKGDDSLGISDQQFFNLCRKRFLASTFKAWQSQLTEFLDHGVIKEVKTKSGEKYFIPMDKNALMAVLEAEELKDIM
ncbi:ORC2-domain-containing protein [Neoconidiobolus thromboides FSU 785]|nr:ORC2-domain-containing protein [Neoconidiobolus thromboides FSU 785]